MENKRGSVRLFSDVRMLAITAMCMALNVILSHPFALQISGSIRIGIGFLPVAMVSMLYGPFPGAIAAALGDFMGFLLFPGGAYLPGLTLGAFMLGLVFGVFLYKKEPTVKRIILCGIAAVIIGEGINTYFLASAFGLAIISGRLIQALIKLFLIPVVLYAFDRLLGRRLRSQFTR